MRRSLQALQRSAGTQSLHHLSYTLQKQKDVLHEENLRQHRNKEFAGRAESVVAYRAFLAAARSAAERLTSEPFSPEAARLAEDVIWGSLYCGLSPKCLGVIVVTVERWAAVDAPLTVPFLVSSVVAVSKANGASHSFLEELTTRLMGQLEEDTAQFPPETQATLLSCYAEMAVYVPSLFDVIGDLVREAAHPAQSAQGAPFVYSENEIGSLAQSVATIDSGKHFVPTLCHMLQENHEEFSSMNLSRVLWAAGKVRHVDAPLLREVVSPAFLREVPFDGLAAVMCAYEQMGATLSVSQIHLVGLRLTRSPQTYWRRQDASTVMSILRSVVLCKKFGVKTIVPIMETVVGLLHVLTDEEMKEVEALCTKRGYDMPAHQKLAFLAALEVSQEQAGIVSTQTPLHSHLLREKDNLAEMSGTLSHLLRVMDDD